MHFQQHAHKIDYQVLELFGHMYLLYPPEFLQLLPEVRIQYQGYSFTDADGRYEIFGLLPANYRITVKERRSWSTKFTGRETEE